MEKLSQPGNIESTLMAYSGCWVCYFLKKKVALHLSFRAFSSFFNQVPLILLIHIQYSPLFPIYKLGGEKERGSSRVGGWREYSRKEREKASEEREKKRTEEKEKWHQEEWVTYLLLLLLLWYSIPKPATISHFWGMTQRLLSVLSFETKWRDRRKGGKDTKIWRWKLSITLPALAAILYYFPTPHLVK